MVQDFGGVADDAAGSCALLEAMRAAEQNASWRNAFMGMMKALFDFQKHRDIFPKHQEIVIPELLRFEHKIHRAYHADSGVEVVHGEGAFHVIYGEGDEDGEGDDFLEDFELWEGENGVADAVGGDLEEVFEKRDRPTHEDGDEEGFGFQVAQVGIPRKGHEDI